MGRAKTRVEVTSCTGLYAHNYSLQDMQHDVLGVVYLNKALRGRGIVSSRNLTIGQNIKWAGKISLIVACGVVSS